MSLKLSDRLSNGKTSASRFVLTGWLVFPHWKKQTQKPKRPVVGRTPRIAKLMALAIRFEGLIAAGIVSDHSELAELAQVSRARITQIKNLLLLAPSTQEQLLFLPAVENGRDSVTLKELQVVCLKTDWKRQRYAQIE